MAKSKAKDWSHRRTTLRVSSGKYKGAKLKSPQSALTHPMGSREKIALFNMLHDAVLGATVLDAYAGSGALGIEALSRGAERAIFVERSPKIARVIQENLQQLALGSERAMVIPESIRTFAERPEYQGFFELIIADPPYDAIALEELQCLVQLLRPNGTLALSVPVEQSLPNFAQLELISEHTYAGARIIIYRFSS